MPCEAQSSNALEPQIQIIGNIYVHYGNSLPQPHAKLIYMFSVCAIQEKTDFRGPPGPHHEKIIEFSPKRGRYRSCRAGC